MRKVDDCNVEGGLRSIFIEGWNLSLTLFSFYIFSSSLMSWEAQHSTRQHRTALPKHRTAYFLLCVISVFQTIGHYFLDLQSCAPLLQAITTELSFHCCCADHCSHSSKWSLMLALNRTDHNLRADSVQCKALPDQTRPYFQYCLLPSKAYL